LDRPCIPRTCLLSATNRHCWRSSKPVLMQRRRFSFPRCCCALLCCVVVLFSTRSPPHAVLLATDLSLSVVVRVLRGGGYGNVGVLVLVVVLSWCLGAFSQQPVAGVQGLPRQVYLPAVRPGLVGVGAAEHLVPNFATYMVSATDMALEQAALASEAKGVEVGVDDGAQPAWGLGGAGGRGATGYRSWRSRMKGRTRTRRP
jgi:hypothetical protein